MEVTADDNIYNKIEFLKQKVDFEIYRYIEEKTSKFRIDNYNDKCNRLLEIMELKSKDPRDITPLTHWCCDVSILLGMIFEKDAYIERGYIKLSNTSYNSSRYFHCWLCLKYKGNLYVFDPCNSIISTKDEYYRLFLPDVKGRVLAEDVKKAIEEELNNNIYFDENFDFKIIREQKGISSPLYGCWSAIKYTDADVIIRFINYNFQKNQNQYETAILEFEKRKNQLKK